MWHLLPFSGFVFLRQKALTQRPRTIARVIYLSAFEVETHRPELRQRTILLAVGMLGASVGPLWVQHAVLWSSHVALLNGD